MSGPTFQGSIGGKFVIAGTQALSGGIVNFNFPSHALGSGARFDHHASLPPAGQAGPLEPCFTVPFSADPGFVDRPDVLRWLRDHNDAPTNRGIRKAARSRLKDVL